MRGWAPLGGGGEGNDQVICGRYPSLLCTPVLLACPRPLIREGSQPDTRKGIGLGILSPFAVLWPWSPKCSPYLRWTCWPALATGCKVLWTLLLIQGGVRGKAEPIPNTPVIT